MDCCALPPQVCIVGGGSAAFAAAIRAAELEARVTLINDGLPIGGTCVNVGCVPSKNLIRAAESLHRARRVPFPGLRTEGRLEDFPAVINQKRELVASLRRAKYLDVIRDQKNIQLVEGRATLVDEHTVLVNEQTLPADVILIATGARPAVPPIPGLAEVPFLTNENAYELDRLPGSLIVLGGNYIGLENAQMFARFGVKVTVLELLPQILPGETADLAAEIQHHLESEGIRFLTGAQTRQISRDGDQIVLEVEMDGKEHRLEAEQIFVATGRRANTDGLGLEQIGVQVDERGFLQVDEYLQTSVPGIFGAGDVIGHPMFVYTAAYEGKLAVENALLEEKKARDYSVLPWVIFTDPQVAGIGLNEAEAAAQGRSVQVTTLPLSEVPRAIAARDTRGWIKLIRDPESDLLLGARIVAPEGSELLMELALAMKYRIPVSELKEMLHPYLTLSEGIKLAAITFSKSVHQLSCCAT